MSEISAITKGLIKSKMPDEIINLIFEYYNNQKTAQFAILKLSINNEAYKPPFYMLITKTFNEVKRTKRTKYFLLYKKPIIKENRQIEHDDLDFDF
jgi:hypothetical protein